MPPRSLPASGRPRHLPRLGRSPAPDHLNGSDNALSPNSAQRHVGAPAGGPGHGLYEGADDALLNKQSRLWKAERGRIGNWRLRPGSRYVSVIAQSDVRAYTFWLPQRPRRFSAALATPPEVEPALFLSELPRQAGPGDLH